MTSIASPKFPLTGAMIQDSPMHLVKANGALPLFGVKMFIGSEAQYICRRKTVAGRRSADALHANLTVFSGNIFKGLEALASIYNCFGRKYADAAGSGHFQDQIMQDERNVRFKLLYKF